ncbi:pseudouridine synthase [Jiulongibacter sediminis]|jgi:23S rRNA pseudouridine2457 synthase|uniref:pseudouridine synthase n=1 Tax=Jiulongibacter sediminis TaxID=1605367 RepID=UPI0026F336EF|nr:pseudouridine synthase [Jiulongibacter sediminis]
MASDHKYYIVNKPYKMLSQFIKPVEGNKLLADLDFDFPEGTHAIGRLDSESEGLLILTTNKRVTKLLYGSKEPHRRTYLVKVQGLVSEKTLESLRTGVPIRIRGGGHLWTTTPCEVDLYEAPENLPEIPERLYHNAGSSWLKITLTEGKYRQVRKMVMAVNHRCKRLIRVSIDDLELGDLASGQVKELDEVEFFKLLSIRQT